MLEITSIIRPPVSYGNSHYVGNRIPLLPVPLVKLPVSAFAPEGWLRKCLELQRDGLTGHLGEISIWLTKEGNAWLSEDGTGKYGWEELPYWLRGYARVAFVLNDPAMISETQFWVEGTIRSQRVNGDFGPVHNHKRGFRDLWGQMLMLQVLQAWYEFNQDERVIKCMTAYFKWQLTIPEDQFLKDYWENSRGGDNLASVYWLYNLTGDEFLLELATKIDRNSANWRQLGRLPNFHNVNIAESFRTPATYFQQSGDPADLEASYRNFDFIREKYGEVPGGMFGGDENCRPGHDDPHQAIETCALVEQLASNNFMTAITADPKWTANSEDVAFNTLPAAFTEDYRSLRYLVAPNMAVSDAADHSPGIENDGPYLLMNPFSSRCCQHNHTGAWVNFLEGTWMATQDNGLAALTFSEGSVKATVGSGSEVTIHTSTKYPFEGVVRMNLEVSQSAEFPLYLLIPTWANGAKIMVSGVSTQVAAGQYVRVFKEWTTGDAITLRLPMHPRVRVWDQMKNSVSVDYGALTFSLKIEQAHNIVDGTQTSQHDSGWKPGVDQSKWPTYEILPKSDWNFGLPQKPKFKVVKRGWPKDNYPFSLPNTPLEIQTTGKQIPSWTLDEYGLVAILPKSPLTVETPEVPITLVPMGAALLRISSFPTVK